jgi:hypothetical protein
MEAVIKSDEGENSALGRWLKEMKKRGTMKKGGGAKTRADRGDAPAKPKGDKPEPPAKPDKPATPAKPTPPAKPDAKAPPKPPAKP